MAREKREYKLQQQSTSKAQDWCDVPVDRPLTGKADAMKYIREKGLSGNMVLVGVVAVLNPKVETTTRIKF